MARTAAVAAGNADTVGAAVEMLRAGGNAFDAVIAAGFTAAVAEPALTSLGGGGFLLAAPAGGAPTLFDFFVDAPGRGRTASEREPSFLPVTVHFAQADQVFHAGWGSVAVPGCLDGYLHAHRRLGRLPLADVVAPARRLAASGAVVDAAQAVILGILRDILTLTPEGREVFAPGGEVLRPGERMRNEALAGTLDAVAGGRVTGFASLAGPLERAMDDAGGLLTAADLEAYAVVEREPLLLEYRDALLATNPPPSFGGSIVVAGLAALGAQPRLDGGPDAAVRLARRLVAMSEQHVLGPASVRGTTHVSVVDPDGNVAAMTTSNGSCSGCFAPGTGIQLNNVMGEQDLHPQGFHATQPGVRIGSMMAPSVLALPDGAVVGLGSGGSERIRSALTRAITALVDLGLPLGDAVLAPRLHWDRALLQVEPGFPEPVVEALRAHWPVHVWTARDLYFGGLHAVRRSADGTVTAAADDRRGGVSEVVRL